MKNWSKRQREPIKLNIDIMVDAVAMQKLNCWTDLAKGEVSCLGLVDEVQSLETGTTAALIVTDFFLVKQVCNDAETDMDLASVAGLISELELKGIDSGKLRCWAHSHADMGVFWSTQDVDTISGLSNGEWLLSIVVNKAQESMMRIDQYAPCHVHVPDVVWSVHYPVPDGLREKCKAEFEAKVDELPASLLISIKTSKHIRDLHDANGRGALTDEEFETEMEYYSYDDLQPF